MKLLLFIQLAAFSLLLNVPLNAQIISTIAGDGTFDCTGDGGPASAARMAFAQGVAIDNVGNIYFSDYTCVSVRKISTSGIITTIAGTGTIGYSGDNGPATNAQLSSPKGMAVDGAGNLYIADPNNFCIRKVDASGIITTFAGKCGVPGDSGEGGPATDALLSTPTDVAADNLGNVFIVDRANRIIWKVNGGIINRFAGNGVWGRGGDNGPALAAQLERPSALALDNTGSVYVSDARYLVRKIDPSGIITTIAGRDPGGYSGDGGPATAALFGEIEDLAVDGHGRLFVSDQSFSAIRLVNPAGIVTTYAGNNIAGGYSGDGGPASLASLGNPHGIAVDSDGALYIADESNMRIRKITANPAGINDIYNNGIEASIYPNPSTGIFTVTFTKSTTYNTGKLTITDVCGRLIAQRSVTGKDEVFDLTGQPGIYIAGITAGGNTKRIKVIVQ